jgi:CheY-like chemotaxis protein
MGDRQPQILIVEDEQLVALDIEALVRDLGYAVLGPATDIDAALQLAETERIDGAVLDIHLNGNSTSYPVAALLAGRGIPFMFVTGLDKGGMASLFPRAAVVRKPYLPGQLQGAVRRLIAS